MRYRLSRLPKGGLSRGPTLCPYLTTTTTQTIERVSYDEDGNLTESAQVNVSSEQHGECLATRCAAWKDGACHFGG